MKITRPLLLCFALYFGACDKCDECASEFDLQFQFTDSNNNEIFADLTELEVTDLNNTPFQASKITLDEDTVFNVILMYEDPLLDPPDTILITYNSALIDTVAVDISFSNDSDCCSNVLQIGSVRFFNRNVSRLIRPNGNIYNILID